MKKILLTGASGFIGKNIKESFLSEKYDLSAPTRKELDLADVISVQNYFKNKEFDVVLHCAAKPGHRNAPNKTHIYSTNIMMFENLLKHKNSYAKFINFGSGALYNQAQNISCAKETHLPKTSPEDEYGAYKFVENEYIKKLDNFINLNLFGVFGKYEDWEIRFISNAICKSLFNMPVTLRQNRRFSYLFIEDLIPILDFFIEKETKHKCYNVVPSKFTELLELAKVIQNYSSKKQKIIVSQDGYGKDYTGDNSRLRKEFVDVKFSQIQNSIEKLYNYYQQNIGLINPRLLETDK